MVNVFSECSHYYMQSLFLLEKENKCPVSNKRPFPRSKNAITTDNCHINTRIQGEIPLRDLIRIHVKKLTFLYDVYTQLLAEPHPSLSPPQLKTRIVPCPSHGPQVTHKYTSKPDDPLTDTKIPQFLRSSTKALFIWGKLAWGPEASPSQPG